MLTVSGIPESFLDWVDACAEADDGLRDVLDPRMRGIQEFTQFVKNKKLYKQAAQLGGLLV